MTCFSKPGEVVLIQPDILANMKEFIVFVLLILSSLGESKPVQRVRRTIIKDYFNPLTFPTLKAQYEKGEDGKYHEAKDLTHSEVEYAAAHSISEGNEIIENSAKPTEGTSEHGAANTDLSPKTSEMPNFDLVGPFTTIWPLEETKAIEGEKVMTLEPTTKLDTESKSKKVASLEQQNAKLDIPIDSKWSLVPKLDDNPQEGGKKILPGQKTGGKNGKSDKDDGKHLLEPKPNDGGNGYFPEIKLDDKDRKPYEGGKEYLPVPKPDVKDDNGGRRDLPGIKPGNGVQGYLPETKLDGKGHKPIDNKSYQDDEDYLPEPPIVPEAKDDGGKDEIGRIPKLPKAFNPPLLIPKRFSFRLLSMLPKPSIVEISKILPFPAPEVIEESSETAVVENLTPSGSSQVKERRQYFSKHLFNPLRDGYRSQHFPSAASVLKKADDSKKLQGVAKAEIVEFGGQKVFLQEKVFTSPPLDPHKVHISMLSIQPIEEMSPDVLEDLNIQKSDPGNKNRHLEKDLKLYEAEKRPFENGGADSDFREEDNEERKLSKIPPKTEIINAKTPPEMVGAKAAYEFDSVIEESEKSAEVLLKILPKPETVNFKIMPEVIKVKPLDGIDSAVREESKNVTEVVPKHLPTFNPEKMNVKRMHEVMEEKVVDEGDLAAKQEVEKGTEEPSKLSPKQESLDNEGMPKAIKETSIDKVDLVANDKGIESFPKLSPDPKNPKRLRKLITGEDVVDSAVREKEVEVPPKLLPDSHTINTKISSEVSGEKAVDDKTPSSEVSMTTVSVVKQETTEAVLKEFALEPKIKDEKMTKENFAGQNIEIRAESKLKGDMDKSMEIFPIIPTIESTTETIKEIDLLISINDFKFKSPIKSQNPTNHDVLTPEAGRDARKDVLGFEKESQRKDEEVAESQNVEVKLKPPKEPIYNLHEATEEGRRGDPGVLNSDAVAPSFSRGEFIVNGETGVLNTTEIITSKDITTTKKEVEETLYTTEIEPFEGRAGLKINKEIITEEEKEPEMLKTAEVSLTQSGTEFIAGKDINKEHKGELGLLNTAEVAQSHNRDEFTASKDVTIMRGKGEVRMLDSPEFAVSSSREEFTPIKGIINEGMKREVEMSTNPEVEALYDGDEFTESEDLSEVKKEVLEMVNTTREVADEEIRSKFKKEEAELLNKPEVLSSSSRVEYMASKNSKEQDDILSFLPEDLEKVVVKGKGNDKVFSDSHGKTEIITNEDAKEKTDIIKNESKEVESEYRIDGKQRNDEILSNKEVVVPPVGTEILASREDSEKTNIRNMEHSKGNSSKTEDFGFRKTEGAVLRKSKKKKPYGEKKHQERSKKKRKCKCADTDSDDSDSD